MTYQQGLAVAVLAGTMALFVWGRWRYDMVAVAGLLGGLAVGVIKPDEAFAGFSNDIVIIVGSALVVSAAVARSGVVERAVQAISPWLTTFRSQLIVLTAAVALMSAFVKNIGALAIMMPIAFQMARKSGFSISRYLMPMAFASLLGGLITLVGTSPNIIVAGIREDLTGRPFGMFDYAPVGLALTAVGLLFLAFGYRLLPSGQTPAVTMGAALEANAYLTEARVGSGSAAEGKSVAEFAAGDADEVKVVGVVREGEEADAACDTVLREGDIVLLEGAPIALERTIANEALELEGHHRPFEASSAEDEVGVIEAVIATDSILAGLAAGRIELHKRFGINLIAVGRSGERFTERLRDIRLRAGDIIVLQGSLSQFPLRLQQLGLLPLAEREVRLGLRRSVLPLAILGVAMLLTALDLVSVEVAFFGAAAVTVMIGALPLRDAYNAIEWPILVMLAALIPVSGALESTGATKLLAGELSALAVGLPPMGALAVIMVAAMAVTPFLNNAATVLVMAPIAAVFATQLGYHPEPFLMAVAVGSGCDFLTPIGHQCNTLVMGPGGYRFGDYWQLGLPLSLIVLAVGVPLIAIVWPV